MPARFFIVLIFFAFACVTAGCKDKPAPKTSVALNRPSPFEHGRDDLRKTRVHVAPRAWTELLAVAIGERFMCGISSGEVYCWGSGRFGELGLGKDKTHSLVPRGPLGSIERAVDVTANRGFACATTAAGSAYCWGNNVHGQLGNGTKHNQFTPSRVLGLSDVVQVAAGYQHACAVTRSGQVYCWGENNLGQLAQANERISAKPQRVALSGQADRVAAGTASSCALTRSGRVLCWGSNQHGELGRGQSPDDVASSPRPSVVERLDNVTDIAGYADHYCAVTRGGHVYCWGGQTPPTERELRQREQRIAANLPVDPLPDLGAIYQIDGIENARSVAVGNDSSCAIQESGQVYCWGDNTYAQLGTGSQSHAKDPSPMAGVTKAKRIYAGARNICVLNHDEQMLCAGANKQGEIGNGGTSTALTPKAILRPDSVEK